MFVCLVGWLFLCLFVCCLLFLVSCLLLLVCCCGGGLLLVTCDLLFACLLAFLFVNVAVFSV